MSKTQKHNLLVLSVAALVASSVAAIAGVTTFKNDLTGKAVYLTQEGCPGGCPMGQWCDFAAHTCKADTYPDTGTTYPTTSTTSTTTTTTGTSGPIGLNCAGGSLAACNATCTKDGVVNNFCKGYCAQECPSTSTTSVSTTVTVTNRCAYVTEKDGCMAKCTCYVENTGSCSSPKTGEAEFCNAVKGADATKTGKTGVFNMTTCSNYCDELKAAPPLVPVVEPPPAAPVETPAAPVFTQPLVEPAHTAAPAFDENFGEDSGGFGEDFGGDYDDFGGEFDRDFRGGFRGGPSDDFGFPSDDFGHFGDMYDMEFDPEMMQEGFDEYFDGGYGFDGGGDFGGGYGGDGFGGMPPWMMDEITPEIDAISEFCPEAGEAYEEAQETGDFDPLMEVMMECEMGMGGGMGMGGPDPEMMENAAKMLQILSDKNGPVYHALDVAKKYDVFTGDKVDGIEDILTQLGEKAEEAAKVCMDLPELPDMDMMGEEAEDFFGLKGLLAQLFDDEEEEEGDDEEFEDDEEFGDDDEEGSTFDGEMPEEFRAYKECSKVLDAALGAGPGQDEEEMGSGLMGKLKEVMEVPWDDAVKMGTIPRAEADDVERHFEEAMADLGFEESFHEEGDFDEEEEEFDEEEEDDEDFDF